MRAIINEIKKEIKQHKSVTSSTLHKTPVWKRTHYTTLSEIISQNLSQSKYLQGERKFELGNTISFITLQRFFEDNHSKTALNDLRFLKTLHKLCIFLGYYDLNEYILCSNNVKFIHHNEQANNYCSIVENLCKEEFKALQNLPDINLEALYQFAFKNSDTIKRIREYMEKYKNANYFFDKEYEKASYEMVNCSLVSDGEEIKVLKTMEHWDFILRNNEGKICYYKIFNGQTYYLKKDENGIWKVWDNYNPNLQRIITNYL